MRDDTVVYRVMQEWHCSVQSYTKCRIYNDIKVQTLFYKWCNHVRIRPGKFHKVAIWEFVELVFIDVQNLRNILNMREGVQIWLPILSLFQVIMVFHSKWPYKAINGCTSLPKIGTLSLDTKLQLCHFQAKFYVMKLPKWPIFLLISQLSQYTLA